MKCNPRKTFVEMNHDDVIRLDNARGTSVRVMRGQLWMTQDRDVRDIVLNAGDVWTVEKQGATLLQAQSAVAMELVGPGARKVERRRTRAAWSVRLRNWLIDAFAARTTRRPLPYY